MNYHFHSSASSSPRQVSVWALLWLAVVSCVVLSGGCSKPTLAPAPNLYTYGGDHAFDSVPEDLRNNRVELVYATDRKPVESDDGGLIYGYGRSPSLVVGACTVTIGEDTSWSELVEASTQTKRAKAPGLALIDVQELVQFPDSSTPRVRVNGELTEDATYVKELEQARAETIEIIEARLAESECKEIYIFIHGYNNSLEMAAFRMAQLWHYMGRRGVPVIYSWPAGHGGLLRGYTYDRESSEFTIYHLKQFLKTITQAPGLEKIHIVAHSRGTDVAITTLRELNLEISHSGLNTRSRLKLETLILAAADLDWEVAQQRMNAERLLVVPAHVTLYLSKEDRAIGISGWLFGSMQRLGRLAFGDLSDAQKRAIADFSGIDIIWVKAKADFLGHGYFVENPAVLSDLILVLRDGRLVGAEHGRPLVRKEGGFWELHENYPLPESPEE